MKNILISCILFLMLALGAFWSAQTKMNDFSQVTPLKVGMRVQELYYLGNAVIINANESVYLLSDQSQLLVRHSQGVVTEASLELKNPLKFQETPFTNLRFVQLDLDHDSNPTWIYAGLPEQGRIFKVNHQGFLHSISWVRPFIKDKAAKPIQALLEDSIKLPVLIDTI